MNTRTHLAGYWQLFRFLTMPSRYQYWIFVASLFGGLIAATAVASGAPKWLPVLALALAALWLFMAELMIHGQLLALGSHRTLNLLPLIRQRALLIHFAMVGLLACTIGGLPPYLANKDWGINILNFWSFISLISIGFVAIMAWSTQFGMLLLWPFGVALFKYSSALGLSPWLQILLTLGAWILFARWWLNWKPAKRYPNPFTMSQRDWLRQNQMSFFRSGNWVKRLLPTRKASAEDLFLTQLRGHNISLPERALYWGLAVVVAVVLISIETLFDGANPILEMAKIQLVFSFWIYLCGGCAPFIYSCLSNLGRCWLVFPGDRTAMFRVIERRLSQGLIVDCLCLGLIGIAAHLWLDGDLFRLQWMLPVLLIAVMMQWALFLIFWLVYCHTEASTHWISLTGFLVMITQIFLIAFYWSYTDGGQTNIALPCISSFVGLTIICLILRPRALAASEQMSFARRPN